MVNNSRKYDEDLQLIKQSFSAPFVYRATPTDLNKANLDLAITTVSSLFIAESVYALYQGEWELALSNIKLLHSFSHRFRDASNTIVDHLLATTLEAKNFALIHRALSFDNIPHEALIEIINLLKLEHTAQRNDPFINTIKGEFQFIQSNLSRNNIREQGGNWFDTSPLTYHPNRTRNELAEILEQMITLKDMRFYDQSQELTKIIESLIPSMNSAPNLTPNGRGRLMIYGLSPILLHSLPQNYTLQAHSDLLLIKAASILYQRQHGQKIAKLEQLYQYTGKELIDPFSQLPEPYLFSAANMRVWSRGENFKDDGGTDLSLIYEAFSDQSDYSLSLE